MEHPIKDYQLSSHRLVATLRCIRMLISATRGQHLPTRRKLIKDVHWENESMEFLPARPIRKSKISISRSREWHRSVFPSRPMIHLLAKGCGRIFSPVGWHSKNEKLLAILRIERYKIYGCDRLAFGRIMTTSLFVDAKRRHRNAPNESLRRHDCFQPRRPLQGPPPQADNLRGRHTRPASVLQIIPNLPRFLPVGRNP